MDAPSAPLSIEPSPAPYPDMTDGASLTAVLPAPRERHDEIVRDVVAPVLRELSRAAASDAVYFERVNKPDWGVRLRVLGQESWLENDVRPFVTASFEAAGHRVAFVRDQADEKWAGGPSIEPLLKRIHAQDSLACLDVLSLEARGELHTSRAQWSLLLVEGFLDTFGLSVDQRLDFYRRGFAWAPELGRWDAGVFAALEDKFHAQAERLRNALAVRESSSAAPVWGGASAARIAGDLLASTRESIAAAVASGISRVDLALYVGHAHSNRLGIHATQEGTMRYLVWRTHGGERPSVS